MKNRLKKRLILAILCVAAITTSACGKEKKNEETTTEAIEVEKNDLQSGSYYIKHENKYYAIPSGSIGNPGTSQVFWYPINGEYSKIPTMYEGDELIYYSTEEDLVTYNLQRYEDLGATFGLCGLSETTSAKYTITTEETAYVTYPNSDASIITTFKTDELTVNAINGQNLTGANVTEYGTIKGLESGGTYKVSLYAGTKKTDVKMSADYYAFGYWNTQSYEIIDYEFTDDDTIRLNLPDGLNSGYYSFGDMGIFRYVTGSSYDENTNFNVENSTNIESIVEAANENNDAITYDTTTSGKTKKIMIENPGSKTFTITFTEKEENFDINKVKATIMATGGQEEANIYEFTTSGDGMSCTFNAEEGEYTISVTGLGEGTKISVNVS